MGRRLGWRAWPLLIPALSGLAAGSLPVPREPAAVESGGAPLRYPPAPRSEARDDYHGVSVPDPFRGLEDERAPGTLEWVRAENELAERFAGDAAIQAFVRRILDYSSYAYENQFQVFGGRTFFTRGWAGSPYTGLYAREPDGSERHLAGPRIAATSGTDPGSGVAPPATEISAYVRHFWPSPDGTRVLVLIAQRGDAFGALELRDGRTGAELASIAAETHNGTTSAAWLADGTAFAYTRADREGEGRAVRHRSALFTLASAREQPLIEPIADPPGRHLIQTVHASPDRRRVFVELASGASGSNEVRFLDLDAAAATARPLLPAIATWAFVGARGNDAWFYTDSGAPRGRVVRISDVDTRALQTTVLPEGEGAIAAGSLVGGNAYGLFGDRLVLMFQEARGPVLRAFDLAGTRLWERPIPASGSVWGGLTGDPRTPVFYFQFLGVSDPATVYRVDLATFRESVVAAPKLPFDQGAFVARRVTVEGRDGARIPLLIAHRQGLDFARPRKLILYGYGAFGWSSFLWYQPWLAEWFLNHDGVFAVAGVRGGGEHGEAWHEAGRGRNRQRAIDDYVAVARWLVQQGLTDPRRLVANSSSLAGSLAATAIDQNPALFGGALLDYPILDLLRYVEFGQARNWVEELGDPADAEDFAVLERISPYHNLRTEACLPPMLVRPGERDSVVSPVHAYKFVARAQSGGDEGSATGAERGCPRVVLLDLLEGAGHDFGSTPREIAKSHAVALAFLERVLPADRD